MTVVAHVAGLPVEEALMAAPALLAGLTVIAGYVEELIPAVAGAGSVLLLARNWVSLRLRRDRRRGR